MDAQTGQREAIFRRGGRVFPAARPQVMRFAELLQPRGLLVVPDKIIALTAVEVQPTDCVLPGGRET